MRQPVLWCQVALMLFASCQDGAGTGDIVLHPTPDRTPTVTDPRFVINDAPQDTLSWIQALLREGRTVGVAEGTTDDMIGSIQDIALSDDLVYYVDRSHSHVRAYNFDGLLVDIIGSAGVGPGEFRFPMHISVIGTGENVHVVVGDMFASRISMFSKTPEGEHVFRTMFSAVASFVNGDMCAMNGHVYTTGYSDDIVGVVHKHTLQGEHVLSFGKRYDHPDWLIRSQMAEGANIACNATHGTLLYAYPHAPIVTAFTESGVVSWQIRFADARIAPLRERINEEGRVAAMHLPPKIGESRGLKILGGSRGDTFWLRRNERRSDEWAMWANHFYRVDVVSGRGQYVGMRPVNTLLSEEDNRTVGIVGQEWLISGRSKPYPQLGIHPISDAVR